MLDLCSQYSLKILPRAFLIRGIKSVDLALVFYFTCHNQYEQLHRFCDLG